MMAANNNNNKTKPLTSSPTSAVSATAPMQQAAAAGEEQQQQANSNTELAQLLAKAYTDIDALKKEVHGYRRRAEKSEKLVEDLVKAATPGDDGEDVLSASAANKIKELSDELDRVRSSSGDTNARKEVEGQIRDEIRKEVGTKMQADVEAALEKKLRAHLEPKLRAEMHKEIESERRAMIDHWTQLDAYLASVEYKAGEARANFGRAILGADALSPGVGPPPPAAVMSPGGYSIYGVPMGMGPPAPGPRKGHVSARSGSFGGSMPAPQSLRRARTPSMEAGLAGGYPSKRPRAESASEDPSFHRARVIQTPSAARPPHGNPAHSRSSSRSSASSMDVDEMLLRTAEDGSTAVNGEGSSTTPSAAPQRRTPRSTAAENNMIAHQMALAQHQHQAAVYRAGAGIVTPGSGAYPANQSIPGRKDSLSNAHMAGGGGGIYVGPTTAPLQTYQTHIFAPPVTGAPVKKAKYGSASSVQALESPSNSSTSQPVVYPAVNEKNQRICRSCGQAGRYKEGKCVEKWGPGPMGPGTVCDRCRKKMKRIERRGTLEAQQAAAIALSAASLAASTSTSNLATHGPAQQSQPATGEVRRDGLGRTDTVPTLSSPAKPTSAASNRNVAAPTATPTASAANTAASTKTVAPLVGKPTMPASTSTPASASGLASTSKLSSPSNAKSATSNAKPATLNTPGSPAKGGVKAGSVNAPLKMSHIRTSMPTTASPRANGAANNNNNNNNNGAATSGAVNASTIAAVNANIATSALRGSPLDVAATDSDADADADADAEAEILNAVDSALGHPSIAHLPAGGGGFVQGNGNGVRKQQQQQQQQMVQGDDVDAEGEDGDADADMDMDDMDLLEAVDAAERNSVGSGN